MDRKTVKKTLAEIGKALHAFSPLGFPVPPDEYDGYIAPAFDLISKNPAMEMVVGFLEVLDADFDAPARTAAEMEIHARALMSCIQHPG